jgi:hypothetical protein
MFAHFVRWFLEPDLGWMKAFLADEAFNPREIERIIAEPTSLKPFRRPSAALPAIQWRASPKSEFSRTAAPATSSPSSGFFKLCRSPHARRGLC